MKLTITVKQAPLGSHQMIGKQFSFDESGGSFGRSPDNDLVLPDPNKYVSSRHGMVTFDNGSFSIHDQSSNGLYADNDEAPIGKGRSLLLKNGTSLKAGEYQMEIGISADNVAPEISPDFDEDAPGERAPPPSANGAAIEELALELAVRLGVHGMSEEKLRQMPEAVTEVIRSCVAGIMNVLSSRRQVKNQLNVDMTVIQGERNNALKFSASVDEAIERMFVKNGEEYLSPETALLEAFNDIADHQIAMMAATIQVHQRVVERFDPQVLEPRLAADAKKGGLFKGEPRLWEEYKKHYVDIANAGYHDIHDEFVNEFSEAYTEHLRKLKQERG